MDGNNVQAHVQTRAESPSKQPKQTQPNANGFKLRTADGVIRELISNLFGFKPMQETSNQSPLS